MIKRRLNIELLDTVSATEAIETVGNMADANGIAWALCGGLAMIIYGSPRLTKDIDIIAARRLPLPPEQIISYLKQGGEHFRIQTSSQSVPVDWILRGDEVRKFYQAALAEVVKIEGLPLLTPEWLVILKYFAGRFKDQEDGIYLLSQEDLVNRKKIRELVLKYGSPEVWGAMRAGLQRWYDLADGQIVASQDGLRDS